MTTVAWRRLLLTLFALALLQGCVSLWISENLRGSIGVRVAGEGRPFVWTVHVRPGSAAYARGLRTGDEVDARAATADDRYRLWTAALLAGERVVIPLVRDGRIEPISVTAERTPLLPWDAILGSIGGTWACLFAIFIVWRKAELVEARVLALILVLPNLVIDLLPNNWMTPFAGLDAATFALAALLGASTALPATYAMLFPPRAGALRRVFAWLTYATIAILTVIHFASVVGAFTGTIDPIPIYLDKLAGNSLPTALFTVFMSLCVAASILETRGADRARLGWVTASLAPFVLGSLAVGLAYPYQPSWIWVLFAISNVGLFLAPIGLTYALINRRLLDLTFVINRVAVFTGVSVVVVGVFVLLEWGLGEWLSSAGHRANLFVSAALALALGLSVRAIHNRVEAVLDNVFFRKRHEDERALLTFAREAPYVTSAGTLLERAAECLERHADASWVAFMLDDGHGRYGDVDENDRALVALRTGRKVVDLHAVPTELKGEFAYPLLARGKMLGVLVLGPKRSGEAYAPDESAAIEQMAAAIAGTLDVLALSDDRSANTLLDGMRSIQASLRDIHERLGRLAPE